MLDKLMTPIAHRVLSPLVTLANRMGVSPDQVTILGFILGMACVPALYFQQWTTALLLIVLNRVCDGIDGELARRQNSQSDAGGFLDICLDFLFYAAVPFGFILADPEANAIAGAALIVAFIGTGSSFLAFAIMAERYKLERVQFANKSFHYLNGLTEGSETIGFFILFCLFPHYFAWLAWLFALACAITIATRIGGGYATLRRIHD